MSYRSTALAYAVALGLALASPSALSAAVTVTGSATLTSDYVFRGVSQTNRDPAIQAGVEAAAESGWYVGGWGSNISWLSDLSTSAAPISSSLEFDVYGGYRGSFGEDVSFDVGGIAYVYPGDFPSGFNDADTFEAYFGVTWSLLNAKYSYALTDLFGFADSDGSGYLELNGNWGFADDWTLNAHVGHQWIESNDDYDYTDWKLGVTRAFESGFTLAFAYVDTNGDEVLWSNPHGEQIADTAGVITVSKAF